MAATDYIGNMNFSLATSVLFNTFENRFLITQKKQMEAKYDNKIYQRCFDTTYLRNMFKYEWIVKDNTLSLRITYTPYRLSNFEKYTYSCLGAPGIRRYMYNTLSPLTPQVITASVTFDAKTQTVSLSNNGNLMVDKTQYPKLKGTTSFKHYINFKDYKTITALDPMYFNGGKLVDGYYEPKGFQEDAPHLKLGVVKKGNNTICFQSNVIPVDIERSLFYEGSEKRFYLDDTKLSETCFDYAWM